MTAQVDELNKTFGFSDKNNPLIFKNGDGDIPVVEIQNKFSSARISLQGANLLSFVVNKKGELIWLSEDAVFAKGKSVRGGIPICWPWFGVHESDVSLPSHGFARTALWAVSSTEQLSSGETKIIFNLKTDTLDEKIKMMWPIPTTVEYTLTIGAILRLELTTTNNGQKDIIIGEALHTYFNVNDIHKTQISGLDKTEYLDKPDNYKRKQQNGNITINEEVDRVYIDTASEVVIRHGVKKIIIKKQESLSTIVWNPWKAVANKMDDLGKDGYVNMLCVESGNVSENMVVIKPGKHHTLKVSYELAS